MTTPYIEQPPPPAALLFAIRSIGYSFEMAVADIIDNSISAHAKEINIYSEPSSNPFFCFLANGIGMDFDELRNAMQLGSSREQKMISPMELGRYGMGLKSASLSQCRAFSVISKKNDRISAMSFDIDLIEKKKQWLLEVLSEEQYKTMPCYEKLHSLSSGTLVIWRNFDKIECASRKFEETFRKNVSLAKSHVEFVFHRFYEKINIYFNEVRIEKRDPFLLNSYGRQQQGRPLPILLNGHTVLISPYTLPYSNSLTTEEKRLLGNPRSIYDEQGLYLYRNERLIAWGSWFHTEIRSELNKLARVQVDIPSALDDIWMLDVKKASAKIPDKIKEQIRIAVNDSTARSHGTLRHSGLKELGTQNNIWQRIISPDKVSVSYKLNPANPLLLQLRSKLDASELLLLDKFIKQAENFIPKNSIHHDECQDITILNSDDKSMQAKEDELLDLVRGSSHDSSTQIKLLECFLKSQAYEVLLPKKETLLERLLHE